MPSEVRGLIFALVGVWAMVIFFRAWNIRSGKAPIPWPLMMYTLIAGSLLFVALWGFVLTDRF
jgi:hypothetical protein